MPLWPAECLPLTPLADQQSLLWPDCPVNVPQSVPSVFTELVSNFLKQRWGVFPVTGTHPSSLFCKVCLFVWGSYQQCSKLIPSSELRDQSWCFQGTIWDIWLKLGQLCVGKTSTLSVVIRSLWPLQGLETLRKVSGYPSLAFWDIGVSPAVWSFSQILGNTYIISFLNCPFIQVAKQSIYAIPPFPCSFQYFRACILCFIESCEIPLWLSTVQDFGRSSSTSLSESEFRTQSRQMIPSEWWSHVMASRDWQTVKPPILNSWPFLALFSSLCP